MPDCLKKIILIWACLFLVSCAARQPIYIPPDDVSVPESSKNDVPEEDETMYPPEPEIKIQRPSPRELASRNLMDQAVMMLEDNKPDESIRTLERAMNISPGGEKYYYLAEAWYMKGNLGQAKENNSLAAIYLKDDPKWMNLVEEQKRRIEELSESN